MTSDERIRARLRGAGLARYCAQETRFGGRTIDGPFLLLAMAALVLAFVFAEALPAAVPHQSGEAVDRVDLIEVNHVYDFAGKSVLVQAVFYDWRQGEYQARAWRLLKVDDSRERRLLPGQRPERDWRTGEWVLLFADGQLLREVRAAAFRESWTQYDVERAERDRLPQERRGGLLFEKETTAWVGFYIPPKPTLSGM